MTTQTRPDTSGAQSVPSTATPFANNNLLRLLSAIRGLAIPDAERVELRDRVLEYSQVPEDGKPAAAAALKQALAPHADALAPVLGPIKAGEPEAAPKSESNPSPDTQPARTSVARPAGHRRSAPAFTPPKPAPQPSGAEDAPVRDVSQQANGITESPEPAHELTHEQQEPTPEPEPKQAPAAPASLDAVKARIAEIKRSVNDRVGNPVNLIQHDREVGQEYMAALLDAIKRSAPGAAGSAEAMQRLERAYESVGVALARGPVERSPEPEPSTPEPEPELHTPEPVPQSPAPEPEPTPEPQPEPPKPPEPAQPEPVQSPPPESRVPIADIPDTARAPEASESQAAPKTESPEPSPQKDSGPQLHSLASMRHATVSEPPTPKSEPAIESAQQPARPNVSVLAARAAAQQRSDSPDLIGDEVTAGLKQLLSEWSLFRKSGFFGTGPSGIEHPLYKRLAHLPMAAVIAGRFEGSTPEIKQNIADYMNGWRYEQGIVHRMEEQFEQYLRRVIKHIIDKQKREQPLEAKQEPKTE